MAATCKDRGLSIIVVGASGDLAAKKIYPALFALYCRKFMPEKFNVIGFARSPFSRDEFRRRISKTLTCRYRPGEQAEAHINDFLSHCHYFHGEYSSPDSFLDLFQEVRKLECAVQANHLLYLAIPPSIFVQVSRSIANAGLVGCEAGGPWTRVVIEKPFGEDRESSDRLSRELAQVFTEEQIFRMDHYLGKEVIQNLLVLRFANLVFEPVWNRKYIRNVLVTWKEDIGVGDRGGYFDQYGIIRDVMQNHLLQILSLTAMEPPAILDADNICTEKVKLLRCVEPVRLEDTVLGQYAGGARNGASTVSYREEKLVASGSITPTFASTAVRIHNQRWEGVPFMLYAGKGLDSRMTEIRVRFHEVPENVFCKLGACPPRNEMVIRVQPDEAINLRIVNKLPGLEMELAATNLDLRYKTAFGSKELPDAYESLLLEVLRGDKSLFIQTDELAAAWDVFTPLLRHIDKERVSPELYQFGSPGPDSAANLIDKLGIERG